MKNENHIKDFIQRLDSIVEDANKFTLLNLTEDTHGEIDSLKRREILALWRTCGAWEVIVPFIEEAGQKAYNEGSRTENGIKRKIMKRIPIKEITNYDVKNCDLFKKLYMVFFALFTHGTLNTIGANLEKKFLGNFTTFFQTLQMNDSKQHTT